jgi:two-component system LytT family sensor kinase
LSPYTRKAASTLVFYIQENKMKKSSLLKYMVIVACWLILLMILNWLFSSQMPGNDHGSGLTDPVHLYLALIALTLKTVFIAGTIFYILPQFSRKRNLAVFIAQCIAGLLFCFITEQYIQVNILTGSWPLAHTHTSKFLGPFWMTNLFLYLFFLLVICSYFFTNEWVKHEKQKRELIETQFTTELNFLKNQVNPHFLFNTLNNLFSIAQRNNDDETANGISKLAGLMRYMLYDSSVTKVSLQKEIKNIEDFIGLNKLRYTNEEVVVSMHTSGNIEQAFITPMLLLPFVENAFKHGISIEDTSAISIFMVAEKNKILFECSNPVAEKDIVKQTEHGGIGLENVKRRLLLLYPGKHILTITDSGKIFTVKLEIET